MPVPVTSMPTAKPGVGVGTVMTFWPTAPAVAVCVMEKSMTAWPALAATVTLLSEPLPVPARAKERLVVTPAPV